MFFQQGRGYATNNKQSLAGGQGQRYGRAEVVMQVGRGCIVGVYWDCDATESLFRSITSLVINRNSELPKDLPTYGHTLF